MSGGVLIRITLPQAPTGSPVPFDAQTVGFTTTTADVVADLLGTGEALTYRHGYQTGRITTGNRMDISGGKGNFAEAIEGEFTIVDACPSGTISKHMQDGDILLRDAWVWIGYISSSGAVSQGVQLKVADLKIQDSGTILILLKSQSYMLSGGVGRSKAVGAYAPVEMSPATLQNFPFIETAGLSFGNRILSQKGSSLPSVIQLTWLGQNGTCSGNPSTVSLDNGITFQTKAYNFVQGGNSGSLNLRVKDAAEANRLIALIQSINASDDFAVILSDGKWFAGPNDYGTPDYTESGSIPSGTLIVTVLIPITAHAKPNFADNNNPGVSLYIVPKKFIVCAGVADVKGAALSSGRTIRFPGSKSYSNGLTEFTPVAATKDGFFASTAQPCGPGWVPSSFGDSTISDKSGTGDVESIRTDPTQQAMLDPFSFSGVRSEFVSSSQSSGFYLQILPNLTATDIEFDFIAFAASVLYKLKGVSAESCTGTFYEMGTGRVLLQFSEDISGLHSLPTIADPDQFYPNWSNVYQDFASLTAALTAHPPRITVTTFTTPSVRTNFEIHISDMFVFLFSKISASNVFISLTPGYRPSEDLTRGILYAGKWLISGTASQYASTDGASWTSQAAPDATGLLGLCNGAAGLVGFGTFSGGFASYLSTDGGATWASTAQSFLGSFCVYDPANSRYIAVGGTLVGSGDGPAATRTSPDGVTWTTRTNPTTQANLYGVAVDGSGNVVAVGSSGAPETALILTSADGGVTWTGRTSAVAGRLTSVVRSGSRWIACGFGGALQTSADGITWTPRASGVTANLMNLAAYGSRVVAVGFAGTVLISTDSGLTWKAMDSTVTANLARVATSDGITWIASGASGMILQSLDSGASWFPQRCDTPSQAVATLRSQYIGGGSGWNPLTWSGFAGPAAAGKFGISFDPPDPENVDTNAVDNAVAKICQEWWGFAGETVGSIDGSTDPLAIALPNVFPGSLDDVATLLTVQYAPWAGSYLKKAYVQNVDVAYDSSKGDAYYFAGWDASGNTNGLAIWNACRNAYLSSGILRTRGFTLDSVHDEATLGALFLASDGDLGQRINWICGRPRYVELTALGNDSASARAYAGCRYTLNQTLIQARGLSLPTRGVVVDASHDHITGRHKITVGLLAAGVNFPILFLATVGAILQVWCLVSGGTGWAGCRVMQSWDGDTYTQVGTIASNNPTGYLSEDMARLMASPGRKVHPGMVAGGADILTADWSESSVEPPVPAWSDYLAGNPGALLWVDGEILGHAYQADQGGNVTRSNTLRRGLYGTQPRPHIEGARVGAMTATSFRWDVPSGHSGQTCYFRFPSLAGDNGVTGTYSVVIA